MKAKEYKEITDALDRVIKKFSNNNDIKQEYALGAVCALGGFRMAIDDIYERNKENG
jgi:hypothetical protein